MAEVNLKAKRGDTIPLRVPVLRLGLPVNLAGATFRLTAKKWLTDTYPLIQKATGDGSVTITDNASGVAIITIDPEDTENFLDTIDLYYDVELVEANGLKTTVVYGMLTIEADVSRG